MVDSMMIDVSTLRAATDDFDESNKLGEGGFGAVYKVVIVIHRRVCMHVLGVCKRKTLKDLCMFRASSRTVTR
jgi:hypothetical protein